MACKLVRLGPVLYPWEILSLKCIGCVIVRDREPAHGLIITISEMMYLACIERKVKSPVYTKFE